MTLLDRSGKDADEQVAELLKSVRLPASYTNRRPPQLSGGEQQRVAIARAFAVNPQLMIADEPVSALDVSVQASILNLLHDLQLERGGTTLFISHDIGVVAYLADEVAVMYLGGIMEVSPAKQLFSVPYHPYTEALLSAVPAPDPSVRRTRVALDGEIPGPTAERTGCPFYSRCPRTLGEICRTEPPPTHTTANGKRIACHIPPAELERRQQPVLYFGDQ